MDQTRDQFLADTGLTGDIDRGLAARELGDGRAQLLYWRRIADQAIARGLLAAPLFTQVEGVLHQPPQDSEVDRFTDEIEGTGLQGIDRSFDIAVGGNHGHWGIRKALADVVDQVQTGAIG